MVFDHQVIDLATGLVWDVIVAPNKRMLSELLRQLENLTLASF